MVASPSRVTYDRAVMKVLLIVLVLSVAVMAPFLKLKTPWAVKLWRRVRLFFAAYVLMIFLLAVYRLMANWDAIYG